MVNFVGSFFGVTSRQLSGIDTGAWPSDLHNFFGAHATAKLI